MWSCVNTRIRGWDGESRVLRPFLFTLWVWQYQCEEYSLNRALWGDSAVGSEREVYWNISFSSWKQICQVFISSLFSYWKGQRKGRSQEKTELVNMLFWVVSEPTGCWGKDSSLIINIKIRLLSLVFLIENSCADYFLDWFIDYLLEGHQQSNPNEPSAEWRKSGKQKIQFFCYLSVLRIDHFSCSYSDRHPPPHPF